MAKAKPTSNLSTYTQFKKTISFYQQGRWQGAAILYQGIINAQPGHADV